MQTVDELARMLSHGEGEFARSDIVPVALAGSVPIERLRFLPERELALVQSL